MAKHFLYLTNERLTCLLWQRGGIVSSESFSVQEVAPKEFERYLFKHRREPVYFVLDLTEEDFRLETIPHLRGSDQQAVLNRKLSQIYRQSNFRHAIIQGRDSEGRRDDRVLYHGITNPDLPRVWLTAMERVGIPIEGIYSAPILSGELLRKLDVFFPHTLLVSLVSGGGLRQTYFKEKQVKFSRLTFLERNEERKRGQQIADEVSRTWQYLDSLRFFSGEDALEVCLLLHPADQREVTDAIRDYPLLQHRVLNIEDIAAALKMKPPPLSSEAEGLMVQLFAKSRLENHFAHEDQTRVARLRRAGTAIHVVNGAVLAASLATAGVLLGQANRISSSSERSDAQAKSLAAQHQKLLGQIQIAQVSSDTSRDAAAFNSKYLEPEPAPVLLLQDISRVLSQFPDVRLQQLAWQASNDEKVRVELPVINLSSTALPLKSDTPATPGSITIPAPPANTTANKNILSGARHQVVLLDATIGPFRGDYRTMLQDIERLVVMLGKLPGCSATLVKSPLDTKPAANIRGSLARPLEEGLSGQFTIRLVRLMQSRAGT
ncbi:MAG: hypothetical protein JNM76_07900 [Betaproteobacteria bacterium]|nr:hypothetical protein [Betaproteobacteria bacterium]